MLRICPISFSSIPIYDTTDKMTCIYVIALPLCQHLLSVIPKRITSTTHGFFADKDFQVQSGHDPEPFYGDLRLTDLLELFGKLEIDKTFVRRFQFKAMPRKILLET